MIEANEIDDTTVESLALFLYAQGQVGEAPEWYRLFTLASRCYAPVWEVAAVLGDRTTSKRTWVIRGLTIEFAEARM
jgi:hypothetical protein